MFTLYNPTSDSDVINVFVYLSKPNYFVLKAAKLVFPNWLPELVTLSSDSTIILSMVCKVLFLFVSKVHKTFREQHPRPAEIGKCEHWLSVAISTSDPPHGTLHAIDFQAMMWFPHVS